jgi:hypothetical protein
MTVGELKGILSMYPDKMPVPTGLAEIVRYDFPVLHCGTRPSFDSEMADAGMNSEFTASFPRTVFGNADRRAKGPRLDRA